MMSKLGCSRTNYHQMIPYPSKDMVVHEPIYQAMERILGDVFSWMDTKVSSISVQYGTIIVNMLILSE